jgi:hypothetical protein
MGTITAATLIDRAAYLLEDTSNVTWARVELLGWLNEAQSQVVSFSPAANVTRETISLVSGTSQELPAAASLLIDVPRNANGPAIRMVSRELLDAGPYDWYTAPSTAQVKNCVYDIEDSRRFSVFPPNTGAGSVVVVYAKLPSVLTNESQTLEIEDAYQAAVLNYMMYRAYSKDTDYVSADGSKAASYYGAFKDALAGKAAGDAALNPAQGLSPANPAVQGTLK